MPVRSGKSRRTRTGSSTLPVAIAGAGHRGPQEQEADPGDRAASACRPAARRSRRRARSARRSAEPAPAPAAPAAQSTAPGAWSARRPSRRKPGARLDPVQDRADRCRRRTQVDRDQHDARRQHPADSRGEAEILFPGRSPITAYTLEVAAQVRVDGADFLDRGAAPDDLLRLQRQRRRHDRPAAGGQGARAARLGGHGVPRRGRSRPRAGRPYEVREWTRTGCA